MSAGAFPVGPQTLGAAADALLLPCDGCEGVVCAITAGLVGTVTFEASIDGVTFFPVPVYGSTAGLQAAGAFANPAAQMFVVAAGAGVKFVRCRVSAYTSGSAIASGTVDDSGGAALAQTLILGNPVLSAAILPSTSVSNTFLRHRGKSSGATTVGVQIKATAGNLHHLVVSNDQAATKAFLKFYDKATPAVVGTDVPVMTILLPAAQTIVVPYDFIRHSFSAGITYGITGLGPDNDATAVAADLVFLTALYI